MSKSLEINESDWSPPEGWGEIEMTPKMEEAGAKWAWLMGSDPERDRFPDDFDPREAFMTHEKYGKPTASQKQAEKRYKSSEGGKANNRAYLKRQRAEHPEKINCREAVRLALGKGVFTRPNSCQECPATKNIQAHHEDYSKPLQVDWLCPKCHTKRRK